MGEVSASLKTNDFTKSLPVLSNELTKILSQLTISEKIFIYLPEYWQSMAASEYFEQMHQLTTKT